MRLCRSVAPLLVALAVIPLQRGWAQISSGTVVPPPQTIGLGAESAWLPVGFRVTAVEDGGSVVVLEDGSVWDVALPDRPAAAAWQDGDFVVLRPLPAPSGSYNVALINNRSNWSASARLFEYRGAPPSRR